MLFKFLEEIKKITFDRLTEKSFLFVDGVVDVVQIFGGGINCQSVRCTYKDTDIWINTLKCNSEESPTISTGKQPTVSPTSTSSVTTTTSRPSTPNVKSRTTTSRPSTPNVKSRTTISRPATPNVKRRTTTSRPATPNVKSRTTTSRPATPNVESRTTTSRPAPPNVKSRTTTSRPATPNVETRTIRELWEGPTPPGYFDQGWTNNNSESLNHVLKSAINWQSKPLLDLIVTIQEIVEAQFKDLQRALVSRGQYRVADSHKHFGITTTSWVNKTVPERERLTKRFKSYIPPDKRVITSTDGRMNVIKPRALGKKIGQRKRKINERTTTFKKKKD
ncbi:unnamed protein product [Mytilus edulis]|uniref:Uncharacterized protein n=1 Tax=Mytilus edulis TaxID=6550 RepID=A0A8S3SFF1_MYTED|nr:unnamed protein product [Mytilus edulis]